MQSVASLRGSMGDVASLRPTLQAVADLKQPMENLTKLSDPMDRVSRLAGPMEKTAGLVAPMNTMAAQIDGLEQAKSNAVYWGLVGMAAWTMATALGAAIGVYFGNRLSNKRRSSESVA